MFFSDHIKVLSLPYDIGLSASRNELLKHVFSKKLLLNNQKKNLKKYFQKVETEYFVLLDDDFVFTKQTTLNKLLNVMLENKDLDIVSGRFLKKISNFSS